MGLKMALVSVLKSQADLHEKNHHKLSSERMRTYADLKVPCALRPRAWKTLAFRAKLHKFPSYVQLFLQEKNQNLL